MLLHSIQCLGQIFNLAFELGFNLNSFTVSVLLDFPDLLAHCFLLGLQDVVKCELLVECSLHHLDLLLELAVFGLKDCDPFLERFECTLNFNTLFRLTVKITRTEESIDWLLLLEAFVASF